MDDFQGTNRKSRCASCCLACGVCRILCYTLCCRGCSSCRQPPPPPKQELAFLCLGLEGSGKSTLLAKLAGEPSDEVQPTMGFSIKAVMTERALLNVKELGGAPAIREYWHRYFTGHDGIIFVIDSTSSEEQLAESKATLSDYLSSSVLHGLPILVVCSKQDLPGSKNVRKVIQDVLEGWRWRVVGSSREDVEEVRKELNDIANILLDSL